MDRSNLRADGVTSREQKQPETETDPLTPSEAALAKVLGAWEEWPGATPFDDPEPPAQYLFALTPILESAGLAAGDDVTPAGRDLLARARKAGVL